MRMLHLLGVVVLLGAGATSAAAQVTLDFQDGNVRLRAQGVPVSQILAEWARRGRTTIVNGDRVGGPPVTLELQDVAEQSALDVVLRGVSGYLVAPRDSLIAGASVFDRIYILPTSSRPSNAAPIPPQRATQQLQTDDFEDDDGLPGPRGVVNPGARLPREVAPGIAARPGAAIEIDDEPNTPEPAPAPVNNPFGVAPGTNRPGVITPVPARPREP